MNQRACVSLNQPASTARGAIQFNTVQECMGPTLGGITSSTKQAWLTVSIFCRTIDDGVIKSLAVTDVCNARNRGDNAGTVD